MRTSQLQGPQRPRTTPRFSSGHVLLLSPLCRLNRMLICVRLVVFYDCKRPLRVIFVHEQLGLPAKSQRRIHGPAIV